MAENTVVVAQVKKTHAIAKYGPLIGIIFMIWVFLLHASPSFYHTFPMGISLATWRIIALMVLGIIVVAEAVHYFSPGDEDEESKDGEDAPVVIKDTLDYPPKITGVIYADTYIPLEEAQEIKLRTMLARTCALCENEVDCWEKAHGKLPREEFLANMECKEGLKEIGVSI